MISLSREEVGNYPDGFGVVGMGREFGMQRGKAACNYRGIERIGLGQLSLGTGEAAYPCRIWKIGGKCQPIEQDSKPALVIVRRLEADPQAGRTGKPDELAAEHSNRSCC